MAEKGVNVSDWGTYNPAGQVRGEYKNVSNE